MKLRLDEYYYILNINYGWEEIEEYMPDDMSDKYSYAKKVKILAPIAWIHHLFDGVFASEYSFKDKVEFLTKGAAKAANRNKLLDWMEL